MSFGLNRNALCAFAAAFVLGAAEACTTVVVGRKASGTGRVIVGHNEDFRWVRMEHGFVPARDWPVGATLSRDKGQATIPQVAHTFGFFWIEAFGKVTTPACDSALNENGVFVTMNYGGKSKVVEEKAGNVDGGVRDQILRSVVERARSARDGATVICDLLARFGLAKGGWIWTVADRDEAWVVQGVNGRHYVSVRVPDDQVAVIPNVLTVRAVPDGAVVSPAAAGCADFSRAFQRDDWFMHPHSVSRFRQAAMILQGRAWSGDCVFALRPAAKVTVETIQRILSSHVVEGADAHADDAGPICRDVTAESMVCSMAERPRDTEMFLALGSPCTYPWIAVRPLTGALPDELAAPDPVRRLDEQFERRTTEPTGRPDAWSRLHVAVAKISARSDALSRWRKRKWELEKSAGGGLSAFAAVTAAEQFAEGCEP